MAKETYTAAREGGNLYTRNAVRNVSREQYGEVYGKVNKAMDAVSGSFRTAEAKVAGISNVTKEFGKSSSTGMRYFSQYMQFKSGGEKYELGVPARGDQSSVELRRANNRDGGELIGSYKIKSSSDFASGGNALKKIKADLARQKKRK